MNKRNINKKLRTEIFMGLLFVITIFLLSIFNIVAKDREFSNRENRVLAESPAITFSSIKDGTFMKKFESYLSDQFAFRDFYMNIRSVSELALGNKESNGVYYGKNKMLFEKTVDFGQYDSKNREAISAFLDKYSDLNKYMMIVPNSAWVMEEELPKYAPINDQEAQIKEWENYLGDKIQFINLCDTMKSHKDEYIYYNTDHHWTTLGAYYAFLEFSGVAGIESNFNNYKTYAVKNDFSGTLESKSGYMVDDDVISVYIPNDEENVIVTDDDNVTVSLYDSTKLESSEPYGVFLGGNSGFKEINTMSDSGRNIIIFKDSYANCFIPFMTQYFTNIYVVDPRYYYDDIESIMKEKNITDILFLYNGNTLFEDSSIYQVLQ